MKTENFKNFKIKSCDLDWKDSNQKKIFYSNLCKSLNSTVANNLDQKRGLYKVLVGSDTSYLSTTGSDIQLPECEVSETRDCFFKLLTGYDDVISEPLIQKDYVHLNGSYYRFINIREFPSDLSFGELTEFRFDSGREGIFPFFIFKGHSKADSLKILENLGKPHYGNTTKGIEALGTIRENRNTSFILNEIREITDMVIEGEDLLFDHMFWFVLKASDLNQLDAFTRATVQFIQEKSGLPYIETVANKELLKMVVFDGYYNFNCPHLVYTKFLMMNIPYVSEFIHSEGISFLSQSMKELKINIRDGKNENYNCIVSGVSGGGKSFLVNKLVFEGLSNGESALIIDKGESFLRTTRFFGGNVFSQKFNPMQFRSPGYLTEFILAFIPSTEITMKDRGNIFSIVKDFLENENNKSFSDLVAVLDGNFDGYRYYFEQLMEHISDEFIEIQKITYVDRNLYPAYLFKGLLIYLIEYFKNIDSKKNLIVDEVWEALRNHSDFLDSSIREIRKQGGSVITVIQRLKDFIDPNDPKSVGNVIFDLSSNKFTFSQDLGGLSSFSDDEIRLVESLHTVKGKYSAFLYKNYSASKLVIYKCTPLEHELFTTEKKDTIPMCKYISKYQDYKEFSSVIKSWVDFKYNHSLESL